MLIYYFNLFLKVNKVFDQSTYRLDMTNTYLYDILNLGNDYTGYINLTENDTINVKGYIQGNVQWLHKDINKMKWNFDQNKFLEYCRIIMENQNKHENPK